MTTKTNLHIRVALSRDIPECMSINRMCFWEDAATEKELTDELKLGGMVATRETTTSEEVLGYLTYELRRYSIEIIDVAVHPCEQRQGVARELIDNRKRALIDKRTRLLATVRESNLSAQLFLRSQGFRCFGKTNWDENWDEDAYIFRYSIGRERRAAR